MDYRKALKNILIGFSAFACVSISHGALPCPSGPNGEQSVAILNIYTGRLDCISSLSSNTITGTGISVVYSSTTGSFSLVSMGGGGGGGSVPYYQNNVFVVTPSTVNYSGSYWNVTATGSTATISIGVLTSAQLPTNVVYTNVGVIISSSNQFSSTQTFNATVYLNKGFQTSTGTFTSLSPGVMHIVAGSSNVVTGLVSMSTETTGAFISSANVSNALTVTPNGTNNSAPTFGVNFSSVASQSDLTGFFRSTGVYVSSIQGNASIAVTPNGTSGSIVSLSQISSSSTLMGQLVNGSGIVITQGSPTTSIAAVNVSSLTAVVGAGSCTNCNATFNAQGQATTFSNGSAGGGGTPGLPDTSIQTAQSGVFVGTATLTLNTTSNLLLAGTTSQFSNSVIIGTDTTSPSTKMLQNQLNVNIPNTPVNAAAVIGSTAITQVGLIVESFGAQTADSFQVRNTVGTVGLSIQPAGNVTTIGGTTVSLTSNQLLLNAATVNLGSEYGATNGVLLVKTGNTNGSVIKFGSGATAASVFQQQISTNGVTDSSFTWTNAATNSPVCTDANGYITTTGCSSGGSGTVNSGTIGQNAYYAAAGTTLSGSSNMITNTSSETFNVTTNHLFGLSSSTGSITNLAVTTITAQSGSASITISTTLVVVTLSTQSSTINNGLLVTGRVITSTATPIISACGSTPNGSVVGNDIDGKITIGGGVVTSCTMTFGGPPWANAPSCTILSNTAITSPTGSTTTTVFTLGSGATFNGDVIMYHCSGWQ